MELSASTLLFSLLGGIVPAVLWLLFWLREDRRCPEPRGLIMLTFFAGMVSVLIVIPIEQGIDRIFVGTTVLALWAIVEEVLKFAVAYFVVLKNKALNEPIDAIIYMITIALGFSALENTLFLLSPLSDGFVIESILTGNLRFVGATLLHTLTSATIGVSMALVFYRSVKIKRIAIIIGLILASTLHALFNFFILKSDGDDGLFWTFLLVWFGIIALIFLFEKIKQLQQKRRIFTRRNK